MAIDRNRTLSAAGLKSKIIRSIRNQGFRVQDGTVLLPDGLSKNRIRDLHRSAVDHRIADATAAMKPCEDRLLLNLACGSEVDPLRIEPCLIEVKPGSEEELMFRYATLHWSVPISQGYGRRLRFLVIDAYNGKLIGLIGLGDPVYNLGPRDKWIGWNAHEHERRLRNVMDAFVLGAVPPYSFMLCGKLIAMLAASDTVRESFRKKYSGARSLITQSRHDGRLALITTTSALGRSSLYNRLRIGKRYIFQRVGFTKGSGEFHFSNGVYGDITAFARRYCTPTAKQESWGTGFRNRREIIRKCLAELGVSTDWLYHGIEREVFVVPLASNTREFLRGQHERLQCYRLSECDITEHFRNRWLFPRLDRDATYKSWDRMEWRLWPYE